MQYQTLISEGVAGRLALVLVMVALIGALFTFVGPGPRTALALDVHLVPPTWSLKPSGLGEGAKFRLIFISSTTRDGTSTSIGTYNTFVQDRAADGHKSIRPYSSGFRVVGCTSSKNATANTETRSSDAGAKIYWLKGAKVADSYADFYDGSWDDEANDKNESGGNGPDTSLAANYPFTGCEHDGTKSSNELGDTSGVRAGKPNDPDHGPLYSDFAGFPNTNRPFYGLSPIFKVRSSKGFGTLTNGGTPRSGSLHGGDDGETWRVQLHKNVRYRIDVKGSTPSHPGGTIDNLQVTVYAGKTSLRLINKRASGVTQTGGITSATGGGEGTNSRLEIKPKATGAYILRIHSSPGHDGTYTVTVNRRDWPQGRRAPDITVTQQNSTSASIVWTKAQLTDKSLLYATHNGYDIYYRTLPDGSWVDSRTSRQTEPREHTITGLTPNTSYEVRVRNHPIPGVTIFTYQWGYAIVHTTN